MLRTFNSSLGFLAALALSLNVCSSPLHADVLLSGFENTFDTIIPGMPWHKDLTPDPPDSTGPDILNTNFVCGGPEVGVTEGNCALEINHPPDWGTDEFYLILSDQRGGNQGELDLIDLMADTTSIQFDVTTFGADNPQYRQIFFVLNNTITTVNWQDANQDQDAQLDYEVAAAEDEFFTTTVTLDISASQAGATDGQTAYQLFAQAAQNDPDPESISWEIFLVFQGADDPFSSEVQIVIDNFRLIGPENPTDPGDFDGDGDVDGFDFLDWQVDPSVGSLTDWQANYGAPISAASAVPEPATSLAMVLATLCLFVPRRREIV